jgi:sigma-B regulation protein RsbU (phosphoserine phosphatase)
MRLERLGWDARRGTVVLALLGAIFALRAAVGDPILGLGFLYLGPTLLAGIWFGRAASVLIGVIGAGLFFLGAFIRPQEQLLAAGFFRLVVFCSVGYAFADLVGRQTRLSAELALQERELAELRALQTALIPPEVPERPAIDLATCFVPAGGDVAGDFFVVAEGPEEATVVVVGDVVGKGLEAARRAAFVRAALAAFAPYNDDPCRLLELANAVLVERAGTSEDFVTAACVVFRPQDRAIAYALAGHPPPILLEGGEHLNGIDPGLPLGLGRRVECTRAERRLAAGAGVLLFTDGLTEARRPLDDALPSGDTDERPLPELFGDERIAAVLAKHRGEDLREVVDALRRAAERFTGGGLDDDLCMVAVRARE